MEMEIDIDPLGDDEPAPDATGASLQPGAVVGGRFHVKKLLGRGILGEVYRAVDAKVERPVAIRVLPPGELADEDAMAELRHEIQLAAALRHKNIATAYGMGEEEGVRFATFEFVDGQSLRGLMQKKGTVGKAFSLKGAYNVIAHVCNALNYAHATAIHGGLNPGNILVNRAGRVKLTDFGVARLLPRVGAFKERLAAGQLYWMAPEMAASPESADLRADIYSVGAVLYELLTGRAPQARPAPASSFRRDLSRELDGVIERCLRPRPDDRFANAADLKSALLAAMEAKPAPQAAPKPAAPAAKTPGPAGTQPGVGPGHVPVPLGTQPGVGPQPASAPVQPGIGQPAPTSGLGGGKAADAVDEDQQRWLVQKDRLDFGPYSLREVRDKIEKAEILGEHFIVDQETGQRRRIRDLPVLADFVREGEVRREQIRRETADRQHRKQERRRFGLVALLVTAVLALGGGVVAYVMVYRTKPSVTTNIVIKETGDLDRDLQQLIAGIKISSTVEAKRRPRRRRAGGRSTGEGPDVINLGDVTKDGADEQISPDQINAVMRRRFRGLASCMLEEKRRNPGLTRVVIDFSVYGNGTAQNIKVNDSTGGSLTNCIASRMRSFSFPKYNGPRTRASWDMQIR